jgi:hypothetical protein
MKTKTTKLLVLLMAVVMQGFVSVSWGQEEVYTIDNIDKWNAFGSLDDKDKYTKIEITYPLVCDTADIVTLDLSESSVTEIDGNGHEIIGANCPLFSLIRQNCTVKNVKVSGSTINYTYTPEPPASISPFANYNSGTIDNCSVENCIVTCQLSGPPYISATGEEKNCIYIGGLAGTNNGIISNCISKDNNLNYWQSGENSDYKLYSGQIAGYNNKIIDDNGLLFSIIKNCFCHISNIDYHVAHVYSNDGTNTTIDLEANSVTDNKYYYSKAIVGKTEGSMADNLVLFAEKYNEDNSYTYFEAVPTISLEGCKYVYPLYKSDSQKREDAVYTYECGLSVQKYIFDYVNNASKAIKCKNDQDTIIVTNDIYEFVYFPTIDPYGVKRKYYSDTVEIASVEDWNEFAQNYEVAEEQNVDFLVEKVIIKSDLDFSNKELYSIPILSNNVTLDGQGHTFSGNDVIIDEKQPFVGLVGKNEGTIKNIVISGLNVKVYPKETIEEIYISYEEGYKEETIYTSSLLCGSNFGTIERCAVEKSVMTVQEADNHIVGFLVGYQESYSSIRNCYSAYNTVDGVTSGSISQMVGKQGSSTPLYCDNSFVILPTNQQSTDAITYFTFVGNDDVGIGGENNAVFYIKTGKEDYLSLEPSTDCKEVYVPSIGDNASLQTQKIYSSQEELQKYIDEYALEISWPMAEPSKEYNVGYHRFEFAENTLVDDVAKVENWPYLTTDLIPVINKKGEYEIRTTEDIEALRRYNIFSKEGATIVLKNSLELRWYEGEDSNGKILESPSISLGKGVTFDGGGYRLKESHYAFVDTVYPGATLKNLMIDCNNYYWEFSQYTGSSDKEAYNAGSLANVNQGTIESCGLYPYMGNIDSYVNSYRTIVNWDTDEETIIIPDTVNIGYLVGKNEGGTIENCMLIAQRRDATNGDSRMVSLDVRPYIEYTEDGSIEQNPKEVNFGTIVGKAEGGQIHNVYTLYKYCNFDNARVNNFGYIIGKIGDNVDLDKLYYYDKARNGKSNNLTFEDYTDLSVNDQDYITPIYHSEDIVDGNDIYGMIEEYRPYCYNLPTFIANFSNPMKWRNAQSGTEDDDVYFAHYNAPILTFSNLDAVIDEDIKVVDLILTDTTEVAEFTEALKNNPEVYSNAIVTLGNDIDYSNDEADADVPETLPSFNQLGGGDTPFNGTFDGSGYSIKNMIVRSDSNGSGGFFKNVSDTAVVKNLNIENAVLVVTNADSLLTYSNGEDIGEQKDTIYIAVFADKNGGKLKNCSFAGRIKVDESILNSGKEVKVCFTGENTSDTVAIDHAFIYLFDDEKPADEGNKVCIVIKQHIGSGRKSGRIRKTCSNKRTNKALVIPDRDTNDENAAVANSEYREFTDEEFASGTVAYWLNYTQKGYTGEYSGEWTQGELYPMLDLDKKAPLVKLVYNITGTDDTEQFNGSTPFVNVGSIATLNYSQKPSSIKVNGVEVTSTMGATSAQFVVSGIDATTTPTVTVDVIYTVETGVADVAGETKEIVTKGDKVVVYGAAGEHMTIVSLRGEEILSREIDSDVVTVVVPVSGIYMVEVGDMTKKVIIR